MNNPYVPMPTRIERITTENEARDIKTFDLSFVNNEDRDNFLFLPGQFAELSLLGFGECPIGIASSPTEVGHLLFTVKRTGFVTKHLHRAEVGDTIGIRGPFGNSYPLDLMEGKNVLIIGGGFAFTTLRATAMYMLEDSNRARFKELTVVYGARSPGELIYKQELWDWEKSSDLNMFITVDKGDDTWKRREGFVPTVLQDIAPSSHDTVALVCGPPVMIKFTLPVLQKLGFPPDRIFLSLEMRMKCGIGKCGRCNIGHKYVCMDGPVFSCAQLDELPQEY
jgi:sulfhydrogenase subunit gamma (sulfur reductase)